MTHPLRIAVLVFAVLASTTISQAQDKPGDKPDATASSQDNKSATDYRKQEQEVEAKLHTTDCSKMPNRALLSECRQAHMETRTVTLKNIRQQTDANDILVAVRNMADPSLKVYLISGDNAISIGGYPEELQRIEDYIHSIDRPHSAYRIAFTVVDTDSGKRTGLQHFALTALDGTRTTVKQGSKIPVVTGTVTTAGSSATSDQMTYLDVGMNFDVTPTAIGDKVLLKMKVEQSGIADVKTGFGDRDPVVRQSVYEGTMTFVPGKPTVLTALDLIGSSRHVDVEVLIETLP